MLSVQYDSLPKKHPDLDCASFLLSFLLLYLSSSVVKLCLCPYHFKASKWTLAIIQRLLKMYFSPSSQKRKTRRDWWYDKGFDSFVWIFASLPCACEPLVSSGGGTHSTHECQMTNATAPLPSVPPDTPITFHSPLPLLSLTPPRPLVPPSIIDQPFPKVQTAVINRSVDLFHAIKTVGYGQSQKGCFFFFLKHNKDTISETKSLFRPFCLWQIALWRHL